MALPGASWHVALVECVGFTASRQPVYPRATWRSPPLLLQKTKTPWRFATDAALTEHLPFT